MWTVCTRVCVRVCVRVCTRVCMRVGPCVRVWVWVRVCRGVCLLVYSMYTYKYNTYIVYTIYVQIRIYIQCSSCILLYGRATHVVRVCECVSV